MTKNILKLALTAVITLSASAALASGTPLALGSTVPGGVASKKMKSAVDGKELSIAEAKGTKGTLVLFTCNHCPFAKAWEERIVEMGNSYAGKGIGVLLVNANDPSIAKGDSFEEMQKRAKDRGMKVPYVVDQGATVARAFGATVTPEAFLFDKGGKLVYHGTIDDNHKAPEKVSKRYLKDALEAVVGGKAPATTDTTSLGCGIKFPRT